MCLPVVPLTSCKDQSISGASSSSSSSKTTATPAASSKPSLVRTVSSCCRQGVPRAGNVQSTSSPKKMLVIQTWHKKTLRMFWPKFPSWHSAWNVIKCCVPRPNCDCLGPFKSMPAPHPPHRRRNLWSALPIWAAKSIEICSYSYHSHQQTSESKQAGILPMQTRTEIHCKNSLEKKLVLCRDAALSHCDLKSSAKYSSEMDPSTSSTSSMKFQIKLHGNTIICMHIHMYIYICNYMYYHQWLYASDSASLRKIFKQFLWLSDTHSGAVWNSDSSFDGPSVLLAFGV